MPGLLLASSQVALHQPDNLAIVNDLDLPDETRPVNGDSEMQLEPWASLLDATRGTSLFDLPDQLDLVPQQSRNRFEGSNGTSLVFPRS